MELGSTRALRRRPPKGWGLQWFPNWPPPIISSKVACAGSIAGLTLKRDFWLVESQRPHSPIHKALSNSCRGVIIMAEEVRLTQMVEAAG